jgi:hypothetical protein
MKNRARAIAGAAGVIAGVALVGSSGPALAIGWGLWSAGLALLLAAVPSAGESRGDNRREPAPRPVSLVS